jgi:hypothetical protein
LNRKIIGGVSALAVVATGTALYFAGPALAGDSHDDTTVSASHPNHHPANRRIRQFRRIAGVHGQATVRTKNGFVQVDWQRGQLTGKNGGTLTVRSLDGTVWQWRTDGATKVRKDGRRSAVAALTTGDFVLVAGRADGTDRTAKRVLVPRRVPPRATQTPTPTPS